MNGGHHTKVFTWNSFHMKCTFCVDFRNTSGNILSAFVVKRCILMKTFSSWRPHYGLWYVINRLLAWIYGKYLFSILSVENRDNLNLARVLFRTFSKLLRYLNYLTFIHTVFSHVNWLIHMQHFFNFQGHIGSSVWGLSILIEENIVPGIIKLAEECGVFSIRG